MEKNIWKAIGLRLPMELYKKVKSIAKKHHGGNVSEYFRAFARADQRRGEEEAK